MKCRSTAAAWLQQGEEMFEEGEKLGNSVSLSVQILFSSNKVKKVIQWDEIIPLNPTKDLSSQLVAVSSSH